jgi:hypothetical protein
MNIADKVHRALRPDAQAFDEVRITTVPRYKMSGLSGDEWRISGKIQLMRKGRVIVEKFYRNVETCARFLDYTMMSAIDEGKGYFAGEDDFCDQEGCSETATVTLKKKKDYCHDGHPSQFHWTSIRKFCAKHSKRGDCGRDDADANYEVVDGTIETPDESDLSPSAQISVHVQSIEDIPNAVRQITSDFREG